MKKKQTKIIAVMLIIITAITSFPTNVKAVSYPSIYFYKHNPSTDNLITTDTAYVGDLYFVNIHWVAAYIYEGYDLVITDQTGKEVAKNSDSFAFSSKSGYTRNFFYIWDTEGLPSGKYTVEVTKKFYSYQEWHEAPLKDTLHITLKDVKPSKVTGLTAKNKKARTIHVSYFYSTNAKEYSIQCSKFKDFFICIKKTKTKKDSCNITGLKKNKTYYIRVRAINGQESSAWTKPKKVKIVK